MTSKSVLPLLLMLTAGCTEHFDSALSSISWIPSSRVDDPKDPHLPDLPAIRVEFVTNTNLLTLNNRTHGTLGIYGKLCDAKQQADVSFASTYSEGLRVEYTRVESERLLSALPPFRYVGYNTLGEKGRTLLVRDDQDRLEEFDLKTLTSDLCVRIRIRAYGTLAEGPEARVSHEQLNKLIAP